MNIFIMRHGETNKNFDKKSGSMSDFTTKNNDLNHNGILQSMKVGEYFKCHHKIDVIYTSPALRALKTTEFIMQYMEATDVELHVDERLFNSTDEKNRTKLEHNLTHLLNKIHLRHTGKNILLVTHNHVIDVFYNMYIQHGWSNHNEKYKVENCSIGRISFSFDNTQLVCNQINDEKGEFWDCKIRTTYALTN
jgi:broad specificity phosphatase PhoE